MMSKGTRFPGLELSRQRAHKEGQGSGLQDWGPQKLGVSPNASQDVKGFKQKSEGVRCVSKALSLLGDRIASTRGNWLGDSYMGPSRG